MWYNVGISSVRFNPLDNRQDDNLRVDTAEKEKPLPIEQGRFLRLIGVQSVYWLRSVLSGGLTSVKF